MPEKKKSIRENFRTLKSGKWLEGIEATIDQMMEEKRLSAEEGERLKGNLDRTIKDSEYILYNLGLHLASASFRYTGLAWLPLPVGTIFRVSWVIANRVYYALKRNEQRKRIHSLSVLLVAAVPFIGFFAYTIPLKQVNKNMPYVCANHIIYKRNNVSLEEYLEKRPKFVEKVARKLIFPEDTVKGS